MDEPKEHIEHVVETEPVVPVEPVVNTEPVVQTSQEDTYETLDEASFENIVEPIVPTNNDEFALLLINVRQNNHLISMTVSSYYRIKDTQLDEIDLLRYYNIVINILIYNNLAFKLLYKYYFGKFLYKEILYKNYNIIINALFDYDSYCNRLLNFILNELIYIYNNFSLLTLNQIINNILPNIKRIIILDYEVYYIYNNLNREETERPKEYDISKKETDINKILSLSSHLLEKNIPSDMSSYKNIKTFETYKLLIENKLKKLQNLKIKSKSHNDLLPNTVVSASVNADVNAEENTIVEPVHVNKRKTKKKKRSKKNEVNPEALNTEQKIENIEEATKSDHAENAKNETNTVIPQTANELKQQPTTNATSAKASENAISHKAIELELQIKQKSKELDEANKQNSEARINLKKAKQFFSATNEKVVKLNRELLELKQELEQIQTKTSNAFIEESNAETDDGGDAQTQQEIFQLSKSKQRSLKQQMRKKEQEEAKRLSDLMSLQHRIHQKSEAKKEKNSIESDPFIASNKFDVNEEIEEKLTINDYYNCLRDWKTIEQDDSIIGNQKIYVFMAGQIQKRLVYFNKFLQEKQMDTKLLVKPDIYDMQNMFYYGLHTVRTLVNNNDIDITVQRQTDTNDIILFGQKLPKNVVLVDMLNVFYQVHPEMIGQRPEDQLHELNSFKGKYYKKLHDISEKSGIFFICVCNSWEKKFNMLSMPYEGVFEILTKYNIISVTCIDASDRAQYQNTISANQYLEKPHKYKVINWGNCNHDRITQDVRFKLNSNKLKSVKELFGFNSIDDITIAILWWFFYVTGHSVSILSNDNFAWLRMSRVDSVNLNFKFGSNIDIPGEYKQKASKIYKTQVIDYLDDVLKQDETEFYKLINLCKSIMPNLIEINTKLKSGRPSKLMNGGKTYKLGANNKKPYKNIKTINKSR